MTKMRSKLKQLKQNCRKFLKREISEEVLSTDSDELREMRIMAHFALNFNIYGIK